MSTTDTELIDALNDVGVLAHLDYDLISGRWAVRLDSGYWSDGLPARDAITMAAFAVQLARSKQQTETVTGVPS